MTNEEKAKQLAHFVLYDNSFESMDRNTYDKCMEMAQWKDAQIGELKKDLIDKACNFVANYCFEHPHCKDVLQIEGFNGLDDFFNKLNEAMEE